MKTTVIVHGLKKRALLQASLLKSLVPDISVIPTTSAGHGRLLAAQLSSENGLLIAIGGDGTIHEVVNGIMDFRKSHPRSALPAIGILACGTGNDFARNFKESGSPQALAEKMIRGQYMSLDLGKIDNSEGHVHYFANSMDAGFGHAVMSKVVGMSPRIPAPLVFPLSVMATFLSYKTPIIECRTENFYYKGPCLTVVIANAPWFGDGIGIAPDASPSDGILDITLVGNVSLFDFARQLPKLKKGIKIHHPELHYFKAEKIQLTGTAGIETDGELPGLNLPLSIEVVPHVLRLLI